VARSRFQSARVAEHRFGDTKGNGGERGERAADRWLSDGEVGVVGTLALLVGGDAGAGAEPDGGQTEDRGELGLGERQCVVPPAHNFARLDKRVLRCRHHVRDGNGEIGDRVRVDDVPEVDDARDALVVDEHVVIVEVSVHHGFRQTREQRSRVRVERGDDAIDRGSDLGVVDE
jgi:hypothetical protein